MLPITTDDFELWLSESTALRTLGDLDATSTGDQPEGLAWLVEISDRANQSTSLSTPSPISFPTVLPETVETMNCIASIEEITPSTAPLSPELQSHPCRVNTAIQRSLTYGVGAPAWGRILAEMSHLVFQHTKAQSMGQSVPDTVFNRVREITMMRLGRSPFKLEPVTSNQLDGIPEEIQISWGSVPFCDYIRLHLNEVARTARETMCDRAKYFVCEESDHPGIVRSGMTDKEKSELLSEMKFSSVNGCKFLHKFTDEGDVIWFGNHDFADLVKKSLYDISCPGWCGALDEMTLPDSKTTVCQLGEVPVYLVASQIAWIVHVTRFYLETTLNLPTTYRPMKRRAAGSSQPTPNPWLEWSDTLGSHVYSDIKRVMEFITGILVPNASGPKMEQAFEKIRLYTNFISRPSEIPHYGSMGSFLYSDPAPLLIEDQSILNASGLV